MARYMARCYILTLLVTALVLLCLRAWLSTPEYEAPDRTNKGIPSVGISLETTYGTVTIRGKDGSLNTVARIEGNEAYTNMMRRLSRQESVHICDPYNNIEEAWNDIPRHLWRGFLKRLGLPASRDVGRLATLLKKLYEASLEHVDSDPPVIISFPSLAALCDEDISDAMQYLKMRAFRSYYRYEPRQIVAAYAGHGMGLCKTYEDYRQCQNEEHELPGREVLLAEYTKASLVVHVQSLRQAIDFGDIDKSAIVAFDLGSDDHSSDHDDRIRQDVYRVLHNLYHWEPPPKIITVILTGESAGDLAFQKLVTDSVERYGSEVELFASNPEFIASEGAAEMAWREQVTGPRDFDRPLN